MPLAGPIVLKIIRKYPFNLKTIIKQGKYEKKENEPPHVLYPLIHFIFGYLD